MIIDAHMHAFPDKVATKAIPKLAAVSKLQNVCDGTISQTIQKTGRTIWIWGSF